MTDAAKPAPETWNGEPIAARAYVSVVVAAGIALATFALRSARFDRPILFGLVLLLSSAAATVKVRLPLVRGASTMSLSYPVNFASLLLLGPVETTLIGLASGFAQCTFRTTAHNPLYRVLFSMASVSLSVAAAGLVNAVVAGSHTDPIFGVLRPVAAAAIAYYAVGTALVASAVALSQRTSIVQIWHQNFLWSAPHYFVGAATAAVLAKTLDRGNIWGVVAVLPVYLTYRSYRLYVGRIEEKQRNLQRMSDVHLATLEALAAAIEAKDHTGAGQIRLIQICADALGRAIGLSEDDLNGLKTAALLHDIGNLAVPDHILSKPGVLTPEELERMKIHPRVGADIVRDVPFPYPVAPLILAHHERWDGAGYPDGLKGEQIPLGARILAVADHFTTLLAERPYRPAHTPEEALKLLRRQAGAGLDPTLVDLFVRLQPELTAKLQHEAQQAAPSSNPLADIAGAHREERILFEIARALGSTLSLDDTMGLIGSRLGDLVPFVSSALFLLDQDQQRASCRYAAGPHAAAIRRVGSRPLDDVIGVLPTSTPLERTKPIRDLLACKLRLHDQTIGALIVYDTEFHLFTPEHRRIFERVGQQAASVVYNALAFERSQEESTIDPLTGLPNRRFLTEQFDRVITAAARGRRAVGVLLIEFDGLRQINDGYGHQVGDRALRQVGVALRSFVGTSDLCVRYAGDEFVAVLPNCEGDQLQERAAALQQLIADTWFEVQPGMRVPLSANIGTAIYPTDGLKRDELLETADARMYRQKVARRAQKRFSA